MARLLSRLADFGLEGIPQSVKTWSQRVCEQIEALFGTQQASIDSILLALASVSEVAPITVTADYTGAINPAAQLPHTVSILRFNGDTDVTISTAWSVANNGGVSATIGAATGVYSLNDVTASGSSTVTSIYNGITKTRLIPVTRTVGAPPSTGSGGSGSTTATGTTFNSITSTSHAAISDELTVIVGASGNVDLNSSLTASTAPASPAGTFPVYGIWRWWNGAAYVDVGTEVISSPSCASVLGESPGQYYASDGTLSVNTTKTGLTVASSQKFQLYARKSSGSRQIDFSGSASAVP
jgi:hypothetical protein